ncbi:hypothetical protein HNQ92_002332 [Rhabdobacter roseus]|uniref:Uncharacterized protein n=1 Tax=Rhabdobacter roseus TaxID=1655419 RepID=A0A840TX19_9BACT|nr:hypothetical protein [Rhabdobacter roseus]MBB5284189.1 hypothetical protein [Rhabdobacter roseus]
MHKIVPGSKLSAAPSAPKEFEADDDYSDYGYEDSYEYFIAALPAVWRPRSLHKDRYNLVFRRYSTHLTSLSPPPQFV